MAKFELKLPKMGESVAEATLVSWLKEVGDTIELDDTVVEIATDKVDSEVPSDVEGILIEKLFDVNDVVQVGQTFAIIETEGEITQTPTTILEKPKEEIKVEKSVVAVEKTVEKAIETVSTPIEKTDSNGKFYSPLVRNIAETEGISMSELETISGTGKDGRVTKTDILNYIENRSNQPVITEKVANISISTPQKTVVQSVKPNIVTPVSVSGEDEIIELSRMGKMIAHHMVQSAQTSVHVQSFIEVDVTNIVKWRAKVKDDFLKREGEKLTYTPIFMQAIAVALKKHPLVNILSDGPDKVIVKKAINLGMAAALPDGNLIVPVIKNADQLNLVGMSKVVNDLAKRSKLNKLKPDDIQGGTYTVTNVGAFGTVIGTPIINQPQAAILALGAIRKTPSVIETSEGDYIGIRHKMFLSHSYDHRIINGALGGTFIKTIKDYLESWDVNSEF